MVSSSGTTGCHPKQRAGSSDQGGGKVLAKYLSQVGAESLHIMNTKLGTFFAYPCIFTRLICEFIQIKLCILLCTLLCILLCNHFFMLIYMICALLCIWCIIDYNLFRTMAINFVNFAYNCENYFACILYYIHSILIIVMQKKYKKKILFWHIVRVIF